MHPFLRRPALAALLLLGACAPVAEPLVAPVPRGAAGDTAPRPYLRPVAPPAEVQGAIQRGTRTATGQPGPRYWQQRVRYVIRAELDPANGQVTGSERVVYHNRSPDTLRVVRLNLYQNLFSDRFVGSASPLNTGGFTLRRVVVQGETLSEQSSAARQAAEREGRAAASYVVSGTLGSVYLPRAMAPGDSAVFEIDWTHRVPPKDAPRTGWEDALGGRVYQVAQWYPQIATYDDIVGLDVTPYTGNGEFYLEYGDFDVTLTLPAGWLVGATGQLENPEQTLTPQARERLARALTTDSVVAVVDRADRDAGRQTAAGTDGRVTWRFTARDVRDFAWAASNKYVWDATRAVVPDGRGGERTVAVHALYRPGAPSWERSARFLQHSTVRLSGIFVPYLYDQITVSEGPIYGMEYPMLMFVGRPQGDQGLYEVIAHEMAHEWFPMMVGADEAQYAWMDEGFATFMEAVAFEDFFPGTDHWAQPRQFYLTIAGGKAEAPMMRNIDLVGEGIASGVSAYYKPGTVLRSLRAVLGEETFNRAVNTYTSEWLLKHPTAFDFFNTVERVAGRDLDWFWYPWFFTTETFDQAVEQVTPGDGSVRVTLRDLGQVPGPSFLEVTVEGAAEPVRHTVPVERWLENGGTRVVTVDIPVRGRVTRVALDPRELFPDVNRRNNAATP